ncbi:MAG: hypothetical protein ABR600_05920 [Actinomycetota bacterium]
MDVRSEIAGLSPDDIRSMLAGLPESDGYPVVVRPLRWRTRPHLAAHTSFDDRRIVLQVPDPFYPFGEIVPYGAKRLPGKRMRFVWLTEGVTFREAREVLRFLYLHEWMHWYLRERLGRKGAAETACERFALRNYQRQEVGLADATEALRRRTHP